MALGVAVEVVVVEEHGIDLGLGSGIGKVKGIGKGRKINICCSPRSC